MINKLIVIELLRLVQLLITLINQQTTALTRQFMSVDDCKLSSNHKSMLLGVTAWRRSPSWLYIKSFVKLFSIKHRGCAVTGH